MDVANMFSSGERHVSRTGRARQPLFGRRRAHGGVASHDAQSETTHNTRIVTVAGPGSNEAVAPTGRGGGKLPPMSGRPKIIQYVCAFIVMELLRITRQIHCKAVEQRATLYTQTMQPGLGDFVL